MAAASYEEELRLVKRKRCDASINEIFCDDVLIEILHRVPCLYAVIRCKSVCKQWCSLISSPSFVSRSITHGRENVRPRLIAHVGNQQVIISRQFSLDFLPGFSEAEDALCSKSNSIAYQRQRDYLGGFRWTEPCFVASCNGLLLCTMALDAYLVCNPFTKRWLELPPVPRKVGCKRIGFICEPYYHIDKDKGCAVVNANYQCRFKVVQIGMTICHSQSGSAGYWVESFCSESWLWTCLFLRTELLFGIHASPAIACNGLLFWHANRFQTLVYDPYNMKLQGIIPEPEGWIKLHPLAPLGLGLIGDTLSVGQLSKCILSIWQLKDYNELKWSLERRVDLNGTIPRIVSCFEGHLLAFHPDDPDVFFMTSNHGRSIGYYNLRTKTLKDCPKFPSDAHLKHQLWDNVLVLAFPYWPTPLPWRRNTRTTNPNHRLVRTWL